MSKTSENRVIIVAGPTASGKSALALDLAVELGGVVINADSMQVYKNMPVISACPTKEEKAIVLHKLYEIYDPCINGTVVDWLTLAVEEIRAVWNDEKIPVVVGGTGLYLDNLINGTTPIPEVDLQIRAEVKKLREEKGIQGLYDLLKNVDEQTAARLSPNDTTRVSRAYEVFLQTGIKLSDWHKKPMLKKLAEAKFVVIKICPDKKELDERCYLRFDRMIAMGAIEEAQALNECKLKDDLPAMKALGVPELLAFVRGQCSLAEAAELGKLHTRQYAKRQRTWFSNKLKADIVLDECYKGQKNIINNVKKAL